MAQDLTPSQLIDIDASRLAGIALGGGRPTSHVAILAAHARHSHAGERRCRESDDIEDGAELILDADAGILHSRPMAADCRRARAPRAGGGAAGARELDAAHTHCHLASGERIEIFANLAGTSADAQLAVAQGAEGCGLLRTEFLFLDRATAPDESEQLRQLPAASPTCSRGGRW